MKTPTDIVRRFYESLKEGDAPGALGLMAPDISWTTMWHYKITGPGPEGVAEGILKPLMMEWSSPSLDPAEFIAEGNTVVSLGLFTGIHRMTGKRSEAAYAHVWKVEGGLIAAFRQYIDTKAIADARS